MSTSPNRPSRGVREFWPKFCYVAQVIFALACFLITFDWFRSEHRPGHELVLALLGALGALIACLLRLPSGSWIGHPRYASARLRLQQHFGHWRGFYLVMALLMLVYVLARHGPRWTVSGDIALSEHSTPEKRAALVPQLDKELPEPSLPTVILTGDPNESHGRLSEARSAIGKLVTSPDPPTLQRRAIKDPRLAVATLEVSVPPRRHPETKKEMAARITRDLHRLVFSRPVLAVISADGPETAPYVVEACRKLGLLCIPVVCTAHDLPKRREEQGIADPNVLIPLPGDEELRERLRSASRRVLDAYPFQRGRLRVGFIHAGDATSDFLRADFFSGSDYARVLIQEVSERRQLEPLVLQHNGRDIALWILDLPPEEARDVAAALESYDLPGEILLTPRALGPWLFAGNWPECAVLLPIYRDFNHLVPTMVTKATKEIVSDGLNEPYERVTARSLRQEFSEQPLVFGMWAADAYLALNEGVLKWEEDLLNGRFRPLADCVADCWQEVSHDYSVTPGNPKSGESIANQTFAGEFKLGDGSYRNLNATFDTVIIRGKSLGPPGPREPDEPTLSNGRRRPPKNAEAASQPSSEQEVFTDGSTRRQESVTQ